MEPNPPHENQTGPPRSDNRPSAEALRKWVDARNPRSRKPKSESRKERDASGLESNPNGSFRERLEDWGTILLVLGVLIVWVRLLLAALGIFPLF